MYILFYINNNNNINVCFNFLPIVGTAYNGGVYPPGSGAIFLMNVACRSSHTSLLECPFQAPFVFCRHANDVAVKCYESGNRLFMKEGE